MTRARAKAKTVILSWYDSGRPDPDQRRRFAADIDRFFDEIVRRTDWWECISTLLIDAGTADFDMRGRDWRALPTRKGIAITSVVPGWGFGWRPVFKGEEAYDHLSWLAHYARQYIHRSNIAKILMATWERHGEILHPFGPDSNTRRYSDFLPAPSRKKMFDVATSQVEASWGIRSKDLARYRSKWAVRNTLDPAIHQGIFHFLRAHTLAEAGFALEAVVAFDCVLQSLQPLDWSWAPGDPRRERADLCRALGLGEGDVRLSGHAYFIRNQFSAHAGGWRWWDAEEYLENDESLEAIAAMASRVLRRAADVEPLHRRIDPAPKDWGQWLIDHFPLLWSAIWFKEPV